MKIIMPLLRTTLAFLFIIAPTDTYSRERKTACLYESVESFINGFARVKRNGKFGFINKKGKETIECKYQWINNFSAISGLASYKDSLNRIGFINRKGEIVCEPKYQDVYFWDVITELVYVKRNGKFGFMNKHGIEIIPCIYDQTNGTPEHFFNGIVQMSRNGKYGILDQHGKTLVDFEYDYFIGHEWLGGFPKDYLGAKKGKEYFYINMNTFEVIETNYAFAGEFKEGMATVRIGNKYGYIDSTLSLVIPCIFEVTRNFSEGIATVKDSSGKWGYIAKDGRMVTPCIYDNADKFSCGRAMITKDSLVGFIDRTGKITIAPQFDYASYFNYNIGRKIGFQDNMCVLSKNDRYGIIDTTGHILLEFIYDEIILATLYRLYLHEWFPIEENYALAILDKEYFVVNKSCQLLKNCASSHLIYFVENISFICDSTDKCGFIDTQGHLIIPFDYDFFEYSTFKDGYAVVKNNGKFGIIDKQGKLILPVIYDKISNFNDGLAKASLDGTVFFINKKGKVKLKFRLCE